MKSIDYSGSDRLKNLTDAYEKSNNKAIKDFYTVKLMRRKSKRRTFL